MISLLITIRSLVISLRIDCKQEEETKGRGGGRVKKSMKTEIVVIGNDAPQWL
jgi:hypothetical protein